MSQIFDADLRRFSEAVGLRLSQVLSGVAVDVKDRLAAATPILTGRARASWNINPWTPDLTPAPDQGYYSGGPFGAVNIDAVRAYNLSIERAKSVFVAEPGEDVVVVSNNVEYITDLNNGTSRQAPAGFFEATVASMESMVNIQLQKLIR